MPSINDFPARGQIKQMDADKLVFLPAGTNYELHLKNAGSEPLQTSRPIEGLIRVTARKMWTVPSGGNFIQPIFGPPRIIQGRVKWLDDRLMVVHAGTDFVVEIPAASQAIDLANGAIQAGSMVNVTAMPGATFSPVLVTV
ncbi:MAG TPA: hypothetical protein VHD56_09240 [Tepidisphaeraceae bacterium]|nr:hypothetical protein [Tepidisphaeraceae bacterium]